MWIKKAEESWSSFLQYNMIMNTIKNNQDMLFITTTPRKMLIDGYIVGTMKAAQAAQGANSEDEGGEEPTGMYSLMARVSCTCYF